MDNFIIAAGGTGAMCARAFIYMAAAGCANDQNTYHILLMDKDKQSDAVTACENLLDDYKAMRVQMGLKPGTHTFPEVKVHKWNFTEEIVDEYVLRTGNPASNLQELTLNKLLNPKMDTQMTQILSTMYTREELDANLEKGFYGNPNIGAPVFNYVRDRFLSQHIAKADGSVLDNTFMIDLHAALSTGRAYVYLMGSLFGGTGATIIPNVVLALRSLKGSDGTPYGQTNLILGGSVIMPYFKLPVCETDSEERLARVAPADGKFAGQTRDALSYYDESELLSNMMNLLLLGTSSLDVTSELYARGGVQKQHFHIVILLAAAAANRFFANKLGNMEQQISCPMDTPITPLGELLVWKASPDNNGRYNTLKSDELDLADEYQKLMQFLRFSVLVGYYMRLRFEQDTDSMKKWSEILGTCRQVRDASGEPLNPKKITRKEIEDFYQGPVKKAGAICYGFIQFLYDVALSGYDWSGYHTRERTPVESSTDEGLQYYRYRVTNTVSDNAVADFSSRWVDLANLTALKDLLEATALRDITNRKTMNSICSCDVLDSERTGICETGYPGHIAAIYEAALSKLGLEKTTFTGRMRRDDVWFCEIYDELLKRV